MNGKFYEINCWMKQLYYANRQWFQVRNQFEHLSDAQQKRLFDLMLQVYETLSEVRHVMTDIERTSDVESEPHQ